MKNFILIFTLSILMLSCQKKETILETEKVALNSVFNEVVDSVYFKSNLNQIPLNKEEKKIIIVFDSLRIEKPNVEIYRLDKKNAKIYIDTICDKISQKIDLNILKKGANFNYKYFSSIAKGPIKKEFWNSNYALPGYLVFSKICFDKEKKIGAFYCTYTNGDPYHAKYFLIYIEKVNDEWKLNQLYLRNVIY